MKTTFFAALMLAASLAPALAQTATPGRTLTMTGQGEVRTAPDMVTLAAGVSSQGPTAAAALAANSARMDGVFAALKKLGVQDKDMQTSDFSVSPQMVSGNNTPPHVTGYQVSNQLRVRLDDAARLGTILDTLVAAGANQVNDIAFAIRNPAPLEAQARTDAVADARSKAEIYAKAAGVSLGPILSISESGGYSGPPRPMMMMAAKMAPIAAGETSISEGVSIVWEIH